MSTGIYWKAPDSGAWPMDGLGGSVSEEYVERMAVDAIPLGAPGCDDPEAVDLLGNPRGVDGNGDGIGGCDAGAVERQPTP